MFHLHVNNNINLRMLTARDAEPLFKRIDQSRDLLQKWLPWLNEFQSSEDALLFIKNSFQLYNNREAITAGVFAHEELVGVVGFNHLDFKNKIGFIGYWLSMQYQGRGIMTQSVAAFITYGFNDLCLNRIDLRTASENTKSQAIAKRLGFIKEGRIRDAEWLYNRYVDHIIYG